MHESATRRLGHDVRVVIRENIVHGWVVMAVGQGVFDQGEERLETRAIKLACLWSVIFFPFLFLLLLFIFSRGWGACKERFFEMRRGQEGAGRREFLGTRAAGAAEGGL